MLSHEEAQALNHMTRTVWPTLFSPDSLYQRPYGPVSLLTQEASDFHGEGLPMVRGSVYRERTLAWHVIAALAFILIGGGCLYAAEEFDYIKNRPALRSVVSNIGGLTIASLGLGVVWELFGKRALVGEVFESAAVSTEVQAAKLFGVTTHFQEGVRWAELLDGAKELELMVWAGRTWRNTLDHSLNKLASRSGSKITLILPDPESDRPVTELAARFSATKDEVVRSIRETEIYFKGLEEKHRMKKNSLTIWYINEAPLYTFYHIDNAYVIAIYRHAGKGDVPTLVSHKGGCLAEFIEEQKSKMLSKKSELVRQAYPPLVKSGTIQIDTEQAASNDEPGDRPSSD